MKAEGSDEERAADESEAVISGFGIRVPHFKNTQPTTMSTGSSTLRSPKVFRSSRSLVPFFASLIGYLRCLPETA